MGRGQVVRRGSLDPVFEGSNPSAPTRSFESGYATDRLRRSEGVFRQRSPAARKADLRVSGRVARAGRLRRFPDTEVSFQIDENIRGTDVFIVQPTCAPVDRAPGRAADHGRRVSALVGLAHHGGAAVLRLCAAGSQGQAAGADFGEAGGQRA